MLKIGIVLVTTTFFAGLLIAYPFAKYGQNNAFRFAAVSTAQADEAEVAPAPAVTPTPAAQPEPLPATTPRWAVRQDTAVPATNTEVPAAAPAETRIQPVQPSLAQTDPCATQPGSRPQYTRDCDIYPRRSNDYAANPYPELDARRYGDDARRYGQPDYRRYDSEGRPRPTYEYGQANNRDQDAYRSSTAPRYYAPRPVVVVQRAPYRYTRYPSRHYR